MKLVKAYKAAAKREQMVREAKWKKPEELTRQEAIEVVKWDKERRRNNEILLGTIGLAVSAFAVTVLNKELDKELEKIAAKE